MLVILGLLSPS